MAFFLRVVFFVGRPVIVGSLGVTAGSFLVMFLQWQALSQSGGLEDFHEFPKKLGMSSSQVTPSFFGGVGLNHQPVIQDGNDLPTSMAPTGMFQLTKH